MAAAQDKAVKILDLVGVFKSSKSWMTRYANQLEVLIDQARMAPDQAAPLLTICCLLRDARWR